MKTTSTALASALLFLLTGCAASSIFESESSNAPVATVGASSGYELPPQDVIDIVDAPPAPSYSLSPDGSTAVLAHRDALPSMEDLAQPMLRLAGSRINPNRNEARRTRYFHTYELQDVHSGETRKIDVPANSKLGSPSWSPDGTHFAFTRSVDSGVELWIGDVASGKTKRIIGAKLNNTIGSAFRWDGGSDNLLVQLVPNRRGAAPAAPAVPTGPIVQETTGRAAVNRTYQDLLTSPHDERLFDYYFTSQLARVNLSGKIERIGRPAVISSARRSPNGEHILVTRLHAPYSYTVPASRFARDIEVWDANGKLEATIASHPVSDEVPIGGVHTGPRSVQWYPHEPATLFWVEALDGGDPKREIEHRDELMTLASPFDGSPRAIGKIKSRYWRANWTDSRSLYLVTEYDRDQRWVTTTSRSWTEPAEEPRIVHDRSIRDAYGDPGSPVTHRNEAGFSLVALDDGWMTLSGSGASAEGERPFVDRMNLKTLSKRRVYHSPLEKHTSFVGFAGPSTEAGTPMVFRRESSSEPPNYFLHTPDDDDFVALTEFPDPHPELTGIHKELLTYERADGLPLSATLYLPPNYEPGTRLPVLIWAYPVEYNDARTAGQVRSTTNRFTRLSSTSPLMFLTQGYAVLDRTAMPVVGDPETMNDNFAQQIVAAAQAAIDAGVERGVIDPTRVGVAGHSYGAFMTANLLAHCDLFRAGIARSGAYNRSLTPFGFQSERRTLWESPETYVAISPFFQAHQIDEPLLLIHGEIDNNSGTFPIQSARLFHALQGLGGTARYVRLPHESHGYSARESVLHVLAESFAWFDQHVKNAEGTVEAE